MITSTRSLPDERITLSPEGSIDFEADLRRPRCSGRSTSEIITHDKAENEPSGAYRALQRTADLRFSDTRVIAHRDFNHAEARQGAFQDHLNGPAICGLFEGERV